MSGRTLAIGFLLVTAVFGVALWYFQTYAFYRDLLEQPFEIGGEVYPVEGWEGIDATSSPLKRRVCLTLSEEVALAVSAAVPPTEGAEPLVAPGWFECFDAKAISRDLEAGRATAHALGESAFDGIDEWMALYPDGRAYLWRQVNPSYAVQ